MEAELANVATEFVRQATQLQEMEQAIRRLDQLMNKADQRAKDAEDKASVAVTAIGMVKTSEENQAQQLRRREVLARNVHGRPRGQEELREVIGRGRDVPECSGTRPVGETSAGVGCRFPRPGE